MRRALLAAIAVCVVAAFFFWRSPAAPKVNERDAPLIPGASAPVPSASAPLPKADPRPPILAPFESGLPAATRQAVKECWGKNLASWEELQNGFESLARNGQRELQWRVLRTEENGQEIRIRLSREPRENGEPGLELKLFSVDEEGLPDALPARPGQRENPAGWLNDYLRGKALLADTRLEEITLPDGRALSLETEGAAIVEARVLGHGPNGAKALACSRKENDPRCRCL